MQGDVSKWEKREEFESKINEKEAVVTYFKVLFQEFTWRNSQEWCKFNKATNNRLLVRDV
jgi:hypothetical protein